MVDLTAERTQNEEIARAHGLTHTKRIKTKLLPLTAQAGLFLPLGERAKNGAPGAGAGSPPTSPRGAAPRRPERPATKLCLLLHYHSAVMEEEQRPAGGSAKAQQALQETTEPQLVAAVQHACS